jgi:DNA-binding transcriptional regulator YhcF (GntR family)
VVGLGKVGYALAAKLADAGAGVIACDLDAERAERFAAEHGGRIAPSAEALMGIGARRARALRRRRHDRRGAGRSIDCNVVAGAANNPLTGRDAAAALQRRGILYVPDFLANCGGLIHVAGEWYGEDEPPPERRLDRAAERLELALAPRRREGRLRSRWPSARRSSASRRPRPRRRGLMEAYTAPGLDRAFEPVSTRRTFEEAVEQIADKVKSGELHVGDRLPSERELAAQMRISRPTLREAVKALAEAGVLEVRRGQSGGIFVASELVPRELVRTTTQMRVSEVAGVLEARRLLEPRVAQLAAVHAGEEDFAAMQATIERQRELAGPVRLPAPRGPVPPARHEVPPGHGQGHPQLDRRHR